jgi:hypothetical protein
MSIKRALIILWVRHEPPKVIRKKPIFIGLPPSVVPFASPLKRPTSKGLFAGAFSKNLAISSSLRLASRIVPHQPAPSQRMRKGQSARSLVTSSDQLPNRHPVHATIRFPKNSEIYSALRGSFAFRREAPG